MPTSTRRKRPFYGGFPANPCRFPILHRRGGRLCPPAENARFHGKPMRIRNIFRGPMWASAPTNNHEKSTNFEGGQSRPPLQRVLKTTRVRQKSPRLPFRTRTGRCGHRPLQMKFDRPFVPSIFIRRILAATTVFPAELSDFANVGRIREIYIPRRRGRCLHRPAGNGRFMAVFRRIRADFPFCTVGADDSVRPRKTPGFTENRCEFATFLEGRCGHRPLQITTKNQRISRADRVVRPYKGC